MTGLNRHLWDVTDIPISLMFTRLLREVERWQKEAKCVCWSECQLVWKPGCCRVDGLPTAPIQQLNTSALTEGTGEREQGVGGGGLSIGGIWLYVLVCVCVCEEERVLGGEMRELRENWQSVKNGVYLFGRSAEGKFSFTATELCVCVSTSYMHMQCVFVHAYA